MDESRKEYRRNNHNKIENQLEKKEPKQKTHIAFIYSHRLKMRLPQRAKLQRQSQMLHFNANARNNESNLLFNYKS